MNVQIAGPPPSGDPVSARLFRALTSATVGLTFVAASAAAGYFLARLTSPSDPEPSAGTSACPASAASASDSDSEAVVSDLVVYPIKSCGGVRVPRAAVTPRGLEGDRLFVVTDFTGRMQTQRIHPLMATISPQWDEAGDLVVRAPGHESLVVAKAGFGKGERRQVRVWEWDGEALDQGEEAGAWFSSVLGVSGLRLVRMREECEREIGGAAGKKKTRVKDVEGLVTSFSDGFPFLVTSETSMDCVRERSGRPELSMDRFRPNVVVRSREGARELEAWEENDWEVIQVGGTRFQGAKICDRCQVPRVDPFTGVAGTEEPTKTLTAANGNNFGLNVIALDAGKFIGVGDRVRISKRKPGS